LHFIRRRYGIESKFGFYAKLKMRAATERNRSSTPKVLPVKFYLCDIA
jgi:hypothetical protein